MTTEERADTLQSKIQAALDDVGDIGVRVFVLMGPAIAGLRWSHLVAFVDHPEPEIEALVPIGVGLNALMDWVTPDGLCDMDDGHAFSVEVQTFDAQQLAEIDTEGM